VLEMVGGCAAALLYQPRPPRRDAPNRPIGHRLGG
jgi:hypothetical protein